MREQDETGGWGVTFHRHFGSNAIHRDGGAECDQPGKPRQVYVFDPDFLAEHDAEIRAEARSDAYREWFCKDALVSRGYCLIPCRDCGATGVFELPDGTDECVACKGQGYVPLSMVDPYRRES